MLEKEKLDFMIYQKKEEIFQNLFAGETRQAAYVMTPENVRMNDCLNSVSSLERE